MMTAAIEAFRHSLDGKDGTEIAEIAVSLFCAQKELEIQLREFQNASSAMAAEYQHMRNELKEARLEIDALRKQNQHLTGIQTIQTNDLFGRSTEKTEDILNHVLHDDLPTGDPLAEEASVTEEKKQVTRSRIREIVPMFDDLDNRKSTERKKRMDLSKLDVQNYFDYDIEELNRKYGEGNWRFVYCDYSGLPAHPGRSSAQSDRASAHLMQSAVQLISAANQRTL